MNPEPELSMSDGLRQLADILDKHPEVAADIERCQHAGCLSLYAHTREQWDRALAVLEPTMTDDLGARRMFGPVRVNVRAIAAPAPTPAKPIWDAS